MQELKIKDWVAVLNSQLDELLFDEAGSLRAIELCAETLAEIEPVYIHLVTLRADVEAILKAYQECYEAVGRLRTTRQGTGGPPGLKESIDILGGDYQQQQLQEITVEKTLDDLKGMEVVLNVKNPSAVVASILARHPKFTWKSKGVFAVLSNGAKQEGDLERK